MASVSSSSSSRHGELLRFFSPSELHPLTLSARAFLTSHSLRGRRLFFPGANVPSYLLRSVHHPALTHYVDGTEGLCVCVCAHALARACVCVCCSNGGKAPSSASTPPSNPWRPQQRNTAGSDFHNVNTIWRDHTLGFRSRK